MVFVEIECPVSAKSYEDVSVLRDVLDAPKRGFLCGFGETSIAKVGVEGSEVKHRKFALKSSCAEFVHDYVLAIEFYAANTVLEVGVPDEHLVLEIEELDISVVVASCDDSLFVVMGVAEAE